MPKVPIDYSKTVIYKLVHKEDYDNANYILVLLPILLKENANIKVIV